MEKRILVLGDGLLGSELVKQTGWNCISRKINKFNINTSELDYFLFGHTDIINCIGYTNTKDNNKKLHYSTNVVFTQRLINYCNMHNKKLIHISSDYVYCHSKSFAKETDILSPTLNWYGHSKMLSDNLVELLSNKYLTIRATFKPNPYPYEYAWPDLIGNFDYVDIIAKIIIDLVNGDAKGIYNVGTELKTLYELAKQTNPKVKLDMSNDGIRPTDTTMNLDKLNKFYGNLND